MKAKLEKTRYKHARKLPNYVPSKSLSYDPIGSIGAVKESWKGKKYTHETPLYVLKDALMNEAVAAGIADSKYCDTIDRKLEAAICDASIMEALISDLNNRFELS